MKRPEELIYSRKKVCGIYKITNLINGKFYIGSSNHLYRRYTDHLRELGRNSHCNPRLQSSWNKYGKDNFSFEILEFCFDTCRAELEQKYIDTLKPEFNISKEVGVPNTPKAGTKEAKDRSKKNLESRKNSTWCNSSEFHIMLSGIMTSRWKDPKYKKLRSENTKSLWNDVQYKNKQKDAHRKIKEVDREKIRELKSLGYKIVDLMNLYEVSRMTINRIVAGLH